ncbi:hypothetical protein HYALB_00003311 [Hymenoscyphus albidus]|uniref:Ankyrin n=1 Tax=Hymenoscyphus albidus TaxID=595503 RepID=A0A9N9LDX8_9HELO|nr:hypothetical protein HYALB_00003311 [Hymenoscyphus albidus]
MTQSAIEQGCDPEDLAYGSSSRSVLHEFVRRFDKRKVRSDEEAFNIIHKIIGLGCDIDACDSYGMTPLLVAGSLGDFQEFQILVRMGANVKATDDDGCGALYLLLIGLERGKTAQQQAGFRDALVTALKHGCSPTIPDHKGNTPFDVIHTRSKWLVWKEVLQKTGYKLIDGDFGAIPVLVSTDEEGVDLRAPISGKSIENWRERAKPWRDEYWCQVEKRWKLEWEAEYAELWGVEFREYRRTDLEEDLGSRQAPMSEPRPGT